MLRCIRERQRRRGAIYLLLNGANYKSRPFERLSINHLGQDHTQPKSLKLKKIPKMENTFKYRAALKGPSQVV